MTPPKREESETARRAQEILDLTYRALKKSLSDPEKLPPVNQLTAVWNAFCGVTSESASPDDVVILLPEEAKKYAE